MLLKIIVIGALGVFGSEEKPRLSCGYENNFCERETNQLFDAVENGDLPVIYALAEQGFDMNKHRSLDRQSPIHKSVDVEGSDAMKALIKSGAWVDMGNSQYLTALQIAAKNGDEEKVRFLREANASLDAKNLAQETALHFAAKEGHTNVIKALIKSDPTLPRPANINAQNYARQTPLYIAVMYGRKEALLALIEAGADLSQRTDYGWTAKHAADQRINKEILHIIKKAEQDKIEAERNSSWFQGW